ncbi:MAG: DUF6364 family protein [Bacteroidales bacterium]|nr:hypothetical protein [Bacteroidales bacterium]MBS3777472.1 hypothetical protein [Bacteroidales bacterium]
MNTKLTLTIDKNIIEKAKKHANEKGISLSDMVENYLKIITKEQAKTNIEITPLTKSLRGTFKAPADFDYKKKLSEGLSDKYLK